MWLHVPAEVLQRITCALDPAGIRYMLTGSFAGAYDGVPRATQDIDVVIEAEPTQLRTFVPLLPPDEYYVDIDAALQAKQRQSLFHVVDRVTSWKIDFIIRKSRAFGETEFARRKFVPLEDVELFVASAEDVIVANRTSWIEPTLRSGGRRPTRPPILAR